MTAARNSITDLYQEHAEMISRARDFMSAYATPRTVL